MAPRGGAGGLPAIGVSPVEAEEVAERAAIEADAMALVGDLVEDGCLFLERHTPFGIVRLETRARAATSELEARHWALIVSSGVDDFRRVFAIDQARRERLASEAEARAQRIAVVQELAGLWRHARSDFILQHNVWLAEYAERQAREKERKFAVREEQLRRMERDELERAYNDRERRRAERERLRDRREWEREQREIARELRERRRDERLQRRREFESRDRAAREAYATTLRTGADMLAAQADRQRDALAGHDARALAFSFGGLRPQRHVGALLGV